MEEINYKYQKDYKNRLYYTDNYVYFFDGSKKIDYKTCNLCGISFSFYKYDYSKDNCQSCTEKALKEKG